MNSPRSSRPILLDGPAALESFSSCFVFKYRNRSAFSAGIGVNSIKEVGIRGKQKALPLVQHESYSAYRGPDGPLSFASICSSRVSGRAREEDQHWCGSARTSRILSATVSDALFVPVEEVVVGGVRHERLLTHIAEHGATCIGGRSSL